MGNHLKTGAFKLWVNNLNRPADAKIPHARVVHGHHRGPPGVAVRVAFESKL
jgi:hypothetical protein